MGDPGFEPGTSSLSGRGAGASKMSCLRVFVEDARSRMSVGRLDSDDYTTGGLRREACARSTARTTSRPSRTHSWAGATRATVALRLGTLAASRTACNSTAGLAALGPLYATNRSSPMSATQDALTVASASVRAPRRSMACPGPADAVTTSCPCRRTPGGTYAVKSREARWRCAGDIPKASGFGPRLLGLAWRRAPRLISPARAIRSASFLMFDWCTDTTAARSAAVIVTWLASKARPIAIRNSDAVHPESSAVPAIMVGHQIVCQPR